MNVPYFIYFVYFLFGVLKYSITFAFANSRLQNLIE